MTSLKARKNVKRKTFLNQKFKMLADDDPLKIAFYLVKENKTKSYQIIKEAITLQNGTNDIIVCANLLKNNVTSKRVIYCKINPSLVFHPIYTTSCIPEMKRIAATRFRLSAHRFKVETWRWSRIPRDERKCSCSENAAQDVYHVVFICPFSKCL